MFYSMKQTKHESLFDWIERIIAMLFYNILPKVCATYAAMCKTLDSHAEYMVSLSNGSGYGAIQELGAL